MDKQNRSLKINEYNKCEVDAVIDRRSEVSESLSSFILFLSNSSLLTCFYGQSGSGKTTSVFSTLKEIFNKGQLHGLTLGLSAL